VHFWTFIKKNNFFFFSSKRAVVFSLLYIIWMPTRIYAMEYIADFQVFFFLGAFEIYVDFILIKSYNIS
jgi:hypothetical protein